MAPATLRCALLLTLLAAALAAVPAAGAAGMAEGTEAHNLLENHFLEYVYPAAAGVERIDITVTSDVPVDILLMTQAQLDRRQSQGNAPYVEGHLGVRSATARLTMLLADDYVVVVDNTSYPSGGAWAKSNATVTVHVVELFTPGAGSGLDGFRAALAFRSAYEIPGLIGYGVHGLTILVAVAALALTAPAARSGAPFLLPWLAVTGAAAAVTLAHWVADPAATVNLGAMLAVPLLAGAWTGHRSSGFGALASAMLAAFLGMMLGYEALALLLNAGTVADAFLLHGVVMTVGGLGWQDATNLAPAAAGLGWLAGRFLVPSSRLRLDLDLDGTLRDGTLTATVRNRWGRPVRDVRLLVAFTGPGRGHPPLLDETVAPWLRRPVRRTVAKPATRLPPGAAPTGLLVAASGAKGPPEVVFVPIEPDELKPAGAA